MGNGYTRQSSAEIDDGEIIFAVDLEDEFDTLQAAFASNTGHSHDNTTGEGPLIDLTTSISGFLPVVNGGIGGIHRFNATTAPLATDDSADGYRVGSIWADITHKLFYFCIDPTVSAAIWLRFEPWDADLEAIAALTSAANKLPYATGAQTWAMTDLSVFGRTLIDDADAATARATLGAVIGTNVQAQDAELQAIAGLASAADKVPYFTGSGTAALADFTSAGRALMDDANAGAQLTTLGVSAYVQTILDDANAGAVQTTLGISAFIKTLLDDVDAATARATLGALGTFASGTKMLFVQSSAPVGWTKDLVHDNKALRLVTGTANSGGSVAFTTCFTGRFVSGTTDGFTLTATHIPPHTHTQQGGFNTGTVSADHSHAWSGNTGTESADHAHGFAWPNTFAGGGSVQGSGGSFGANTAGATAGRNAAHVHFVSGQTGGISANHFHGVTISGQTGSIGSGGAHSHTFTSTSFDMAVQYVDTIIATKD